MAKKKADIKAVKEKKLDDLAIKGVSKECKNAQLILKKAHSISSAMLHCFALLRIERGSLRGGTTDNEQATLRAMLVMAAAGLDSMVKQLIRDTLTTLSHKDEDVNEKLSKFLKRRLEGKVAADLLSEVLLAKDQRKQVIEVYIEDLTGSSLQSPTELYKAAEALGLETRGIDKKEDGRIFHARNQIIHELDIDLAAKRRSYNLRGLDEMVKWTNRLFVIGKQFIEEASKKLKA